MSIYVSGSLAFDRIMTFPGSFQDHILMDKLHMINVSFHVDSMEERRGGCAGNIAYSLALLGEKPIIISSAGRDFSSYAEQLENIGLTTEGIYKDKDLFTALCFITTDLNSNQITGFYPGAMTKSSEYSFPNLDVERDIAIVSPGNIDDMKKLVSFYKQKGIAYIFDPGQQLPMLSGDELLNAIEGSFACITNDYELSMMCKKIGKSEEELIGRTLWLVTTLGGEGQRVRGTDGTDKHIQIVPIDEVLDPTGAGDAHRAGLLKGLVHGLSVPDAAKLGAVSASFCIEKRGTQEHKYTIKEFINRYNSVFGSIPRELF